MMKTATLYIYQLHGCNEWQCDVTYRGSVLASFNRMHVLNWESMKQGCIDRAKAWAECNGFTHYKIKDKP